MRFCDRTACVFFLILSVIAQSAFSQACPAPDVATVTVPRGALSVTLSWASKSAQVYQNDVWDCDCAHRVGTLSGGAWSFTVTVDGSPVPLSDASGSVTAYGYGPTGTSMCSNHGPDATPPVIPGPVPHSYTLDVSSLTQSHSIEVVSTAIGCGSGTSQYMGNGTDDPRFQPGPAYSFEYPIRVIPNATWLERNPVIFLPGIGASELKDRNTNSRLWPSIGGLFSGRLTLDPALANPPLVYASDLIHHFPASDVYGLLVGWLEGAGYTRYDDHSDSIYRTYDGCEMSQSDAMLFLFPYDWRKSNNESAAGLRELVSCARKLHPHALGIDIVAHSMGGLVAKRYIDDGGEFNRLITIATPWSGAPKGIWVLETGGFLSGIGGLLTSRPIAHIAPWMTGMNELLPTAHYFALAAATPGARWPFREDGWDLNGNGTDTDSLTYPDMVTILDSRHPSTYPYTPQPNPGSANLAFHGPNGEADFWDDANGRYTQFVGNAGAYCTIA
ncbi:MAG: esterase, partial [Acidobacteria bacterium]|nr:esterase [Acidobacteriota bacterium]